MYSMKHEDFETTSRPKINGPLNLFNCLGKQLDFMILLSSMAGMIGSPGQGNYAAGCTFQDAFAKYASSQGVRTVSLDLGLIDSVGYASENRKRTETNHFIDSFPPIRISEVLTMIDFARSSNVSAESCQIISGLTKCKRDGFMVGIPQQLLSDAQFSHLQLSTNDLKEEPDKADSNDWRSKIRNSRFSEEASTLICQALKGALSRILSVNYEDIVESRIVLSLGADSLVGVELANWIRLDLETDISLLDVLKPIPIRELALMVTRSSKLLSGSSQDDQKLLLARQTTSLPTVNPENSEQAVIEIINTYSEELLSWNSSPEIESQSQYEVVLLTGFTGTIGTLLLELLAKSPRISKIYALGLGKNRATQLVEGPDSKGWLKNNIEVLQYDMGSSSLGLDECITKDCQPKSPLLFTMLGRWTS